MKVLRSITEVHLTPFTVIQVKCDGEFNLLNYEKNGETYTLNRWGRLRKDFPALNQLITALQEQPIQKAQFLCELYAKEGDHPLKLPQFIHYIKSQNPALHEKIHIGIWDWIRTDGTQVKQTAEWKYAELEQIFRNCSLVEVLPNLKPKTLVDVKTFWQIYVEKLGYEGLVIRHNNSVAKLKPKGELDAVVIAINKKSGYGKANLFKQQQVTSLHFALMTPTGDFVEIGDCASGIDHQLRRTLWKLLDYKIAEDTERVWLPPRIIANIEYTDLFKSQNKVYQLTPQGYTLKKTISLVRLRHPRLIAFRPDKKVTPQDLSIQQIPQKYLTEES